MVLIFPQLRIDLIARLATFRLATFILATLVLVLACLIPPGQYAFAADISKISVNKDGFYIIKSGETRLRIQIGMKKAPNVFFMGGGKPRVVIDIKDVDLSRGLIARAGGKSYFNGNRAITRLRFARRGEQDMRFVADLEPGARFVSHNYENGVLEVVVKSEAENKPASQIYAVPTPRLKSSLYSQMQGGIPIPRLKSSRRQFAAKKPVIVIDPGHGGYDPGAVGAARVVEEHVTLKAAIELRRQLQAGGKYKVVLTRARDTYVDHDKRLLIARKAGADLFISLHADSLGKSTARGASVYTLSSRAEARTHKVVSSQNWVLDVDLAQKSAPVSNILVDLAQRKTLTKSERFSNILIPELRKTTRLLGNTHRRAGYYVLLAPDVPAVLLEMGFLSNPQDEKLLNSAAHRKKLMKSVVKAIDKYFGQT